MCLAVLTVVVAALIIHSDEVIELRRQLRVQIDRQYNYQMYGKMDYCNQTFQSDTLIEPLKVNIVNQNDAIKRFGSAIEKLTGIVSLALVGGSGVGKTLTCNVIQSNFQWQGNVLYFVWSNVYSTSSQYHKIMNSLQENSKQCGSHLVIVDSIEIKYSETIQELNDEIRKRFHAGDITILIVYVFNLASYSDVDLQTMNEKRVRLENLSDITAINFRSFDRDDVERCIVLESGKLKVSLSDEEIDEIFEYIDSPRSGCKLVHSKIAMYT